MVVHCIRVAWGSIFFSSFFVKYADKTYASDFVCRFALSALDYIYSSHCPFSRFRSFQDIALHKSSKTLRNHSKILEAFQRMAFWPFSYPLGKRLGTLFSAIFLAFCSMDFFGYSTRWFVCKHSIKNKDIERERFNHFEQVPSWLYSKRKFMKCL